jgi:hypothetical protein
VNAQGTASAPRRLGRAILWFVVFAVVVLGGLNLMFNRRFTEDGQVFTASRWTTGNRAFPTQIAVFPGRVVRYTPKLFGHLEETIAVDQIASVKIQAGMMFADVLIETTGGSQPIVCHGHWKKDAEAIRQAISEAQEKRRKQPGS